MAKKMVKELNDLVDKLLRKENEIKVFHIIVQWFYETDFQSKNVINLGGDQRVKTIEDKWHKISEMFGGMGYSSKNYSPEKIRQKFYKWSEFYAKNYYKLNGKLRLEFQEIFDLMKIVHILDFNKLWKPYDWNVILLKDIANNGRIKNYLDDLENRRLDLTPKEKSGKPSESKIKYMLRKMSAKLIDNLEDIEAFNLMVQMMESKAFYMENGIINWKKISENMCAFGYSSIDYSDIKCRENFYEWSEFYAQNYDKLEGKLIPKLQQTFDLLKIVHVLEPTKLWRSEDSTFILLNRISVNLDPFSYFECVEKERIYSLNSIKKSVYQRGNGPMRPKQSEKEWESVVQDLKQIGKLRQTASQNNYIIYDEVVSNFDDMNLSKDLLRGIYAYGLEKPSSIQQKAIVPFVNGTDIIAQAQSGTGKTAAFAIGLLQQIDTSLNECQALILAPTRELAQQIQKVVLDLGKYMDIGCNVFIGGNRVLNDVMLFQLKDIKHNKVHIAVGTIGRVYDLIERKVLSLEHIKMLVLDEADQLLDFSPLFSEHKKSRNFASLIFDIIKSLNPKTQMFFSSATMSAEIRKVSTWLMRNPTRILVKNEELTLEGIKQFYVLTDSESFKLESFCDLYNSLSKRQTFVYLNTRKGVDSLANQLLLKDIAVTPIHGNMEQSTREDILRQFRLGISRILITSDLLGRGIDVQQVSLVINYDLPKDRDTYIHRVGRSGRFGRKGIAITFVSTTQLESLKDLQKYYNTNIEEMSTNLSELL